MKFTLAITAFRETMRGKGEWLCECIRPVIDCELVDEILIVDDGSFDWVETADIIEARVSHTKLNFYHFGENQCVFGSKVASVCHAQNDWVQLCDSDNIMGPDHFERLAEVVADCNVWYLPSFARPVFDYRHLACQRPYTMKDCAALIGQPRFDCMMNTGNQCVHRVVFDNLFRRFLGQPAHLTYPSDWLNVPAMPPKDTEEYRQTFHSLDSFLLNLFWLRHGGRLHVVPGLEYDHRVTGEKDDSNYNRAPDYKDQFGRHLLKVLGG